MYVLIKLFQDSNWDYINKISFPNDAYIPFLLKIPTAFDKTFQEVKIRIKTKTLSPSRTKGLPKSSKKQKLL